MSYPSISELNNRLEYHPVSGKLFWKTAHRKKKVGDEAGNIHPYGYRVIGFNGKAYGAHRIAWAIHYGKWPDLIIDHINGDRADNRIVNLRDVSTSVNLQNRKSARAGKKIPLLGVRQNQGSKTFSATINIDGKSHWLGSYDTANKAHEAYLKVKAKHHKGNGAYAPMAEVANG